MFWVNHEVQVVALIGIKGHDSGSSTGCIIIGKLSQGKEFVPVVLDAEDPDILLQGLVGLFRLTVSFRVVTGGEMKLHVECKSKGPDEVRHKFGSSIRSDVAWDAML